MTENRNYEDAIKYYNRSLSVLENNSINDRTYLKQTALNNLGYCYQQMGNHKIAIDLFKKAYNSSDFARDLALKAMLLDNLGYSQFQKNPKIFSPKIFFESLKIRNDNKIIPGIILSNIHIAEYFYRHRKSDHALEYIQRAISYSRKYKLPLEESLSLRLIAKIDEPSKYIERINFLHDSLQLAERRARNKFARIAFETDEITQEKDQAIQDKWLVISVASLALMLTLTLTIIIRQRAKQKELVFAREQEIANNSIYQLMHDQQAKINEGRQIEKKRIARELHDGVMNRLASTRLNLFILNKKKDEETINKCLPFINEIQGIEKEIRQVAHDLDNELFSGNVTFNTILEELFRSRNAVGSAKIHHDITAEVNWNAVDSALKINLYRIIQEAINNVEKHAHAKNLYVTLIAEEQQLKLIVHDDGQGFDKSRIRHGIGLKNIADRAAMSGGTVDIKSGKGKGTILTVSMPIKDVV